MAPRHLSLGHDLHVPPKNSGKFSAFTSSSNLGLYLDPTIIILSYVF